MTLEEENNILVARIEELEHLVRTWKGYVYVMHDRLGPLCHRANRLFLDNRKLEAENSELRKKLLYYENRYESG